jgi:hypothetical protein
VFIFMCREMNVIDHIFAESTCQISQVFCAKNILPVIAYLLYSERIGTFQKGSVCSSCGFQLT